MSHTHTFSHPPSLRDLKPQVVDATHQPAWSLRVLSMLRRLRVSVVLPVALLASCGSPTAKIESAHGGSTVVNSTVPAGDPWLDAVLVAKNPLAVAYGFPDDMTQLSEGLYRSFQRKYSRCLQAEGYDIQPDLGTDPTVDAANMEAINNEPLERRQAYLEISARCEDVAGRQTYLVLAVIPQDDNPSTARPPTSSPTPDEARRLELDLILDNREVLEQVVVNLEIDE